MSLTTKPHSVTVTPITEPVDGTTLAVSVPTEGTAVTVEGHLIPKTPGAVLASHGVDLRRPSLFLCDTDDAATFVPGYLVSLGARRFVVASEPRTFDADTSGVTNYSDVMLDELRAREA